MSTASRSPNVRALRIAQVVDTLEIGGLESVAVGLANALADRGQASALLSTRRDGPLLQQLSPSVEHACARRTSTLDPLGMARVARWLRRFRPDVVHAHDLGSASLMWTVLRALRHPAALVMHDHNGPRIGRPLSQRESWILPRLEAYVAVAEGLAVRAREAGLDDDRIAVLRNGVSIPPLTPLPDGPLRIVQIANLRHPKNQQMAVRTAARLVPHIPDLQWVLVGRAPDDDPYVQTILRTIDEHALTETVRVHGPSNAVGPLIAGAHIGVLTSRDEGMPLSILEVLAHARAAVMTNVGDAPELIRRTDAGAVVDVDDDDAMADALAQLWADRNRLTEAGLRGRAAVAAEYGTDAMVDAVTECYQRAWSRRHRA